MFNFCKFSCGGHRLPAETGRWHNVSRADRLCHLCDSADIGDEIHYMMSCNYLKQERENIYRVIAVIMSIHSKLMSYFLHVIFVVVMADLCKITVPQLNACIFPM
jgi:hypothetical protein